MDEQQLHKVRFGTGFIAALDQSGGSTPKALAQYGIPPEAYSGDAEMFALMHRMRSRIITSPSFTGNRVLGAILFENTMDRQIEGRDSAEYLWAVKRVVHPSRPRTNETNCLPIPSGESHKLTDVSSARSTGLGV